MESSISSTSSTSGSSINTMILITLCMVVILHLVYNNSLFCKVSKSDDNMNDNVDENMRNLDLNDLDGYNNLNNPSRNLRTYDDHRDRDNGTHGLNRTSRSKKWYHYMNKQAVNDISRKKKNGMKRKNNRKKTLVFDDIYQGVLIPEKFYNKPNVENDNNIECENGTGILENKFENVDGDICTIAKDAMRVKKYIREKVLGGDAQCECVVDKSKSEFTRDEIDAYREKQITFRDKIYGTSSPAVDPVDKMNEIMLKGGIRGNGQSIANFYDSLVSNHSD
jgi:hypothetical protein